MIFRKPYAFLIKYFRLINFILAGLAIYIAYRSYNIISFFNNYVTHDYSGNFYAGFSDTYISAFVYVIIILIIFGILCIYVLFLYKKKPTKAYLASIIYYIILFIFFNILKNVMITLESNVITAEGARIYRDLSMISVVPQIYFIILFLFRGFGFNIGKFNFKEDLKELEISEQDSEEVEITLNNKDDFKLKRILRRFGREFKYYIKENKFIMIIIVIILGVVIAFGIYKSLPENVDKDYKQGETFNINNLVFNIEDSIITNLDYKGDLLDEKAYYVVAKLFVENKGTEDIQIDYNDFRLTVNNKYIYPTIDIGINFIDYAEDYKSKTIKKGTKQLFSLVYKINEKDIKKSYQIKISNGSTFSDDIFIGSFDYVTITPIIINKTNVEKTVNQGEEISFKNSNLGNTLLTINNSIFTNQYIYDYEVCQNDSCNTYKDMVNINYTKNDKTLIIFDYQYTLDSEVPFYEHSTSMNKFVERFLKIKYIDSDDNKYFTVNNVTPAKLKDKIVLEVSNKVNELNELYLSFVIRNKEYLIKLK